MEKLYLDIDAAGCFDYSSGKDLVYKTKTELRTMLLDRIAIYKRNQYETNLNIKLLQGTG